MIRVCNFNDNGGNDPSWQMEKFTNENKIKKEQIISINTNIVPNLEHSQYHINVMMVFEEN